MTEASTDASFARIVEWAYSTLPEKIRNLPDFPGIQVADEPPVDILERIQKLRNWPKGRELLGLYSGVHRNQPQHFLSRTAPDLIFVFRGPILRCSRGNLPAEVKQVVWHEVAHWLGHDEEEVKRLGLSLSFKNIGRDPLEAELATVFEQQRPLSTTEEDDGANQRPRCLKCYSPDVSCRELDKPLTNASSSLGDPIAIHSRICTCNSCGYEWDDEDDL
ncbi:MAG TPA: metallopeptidase family protein [Candidatus Binatia bacterium]|nr:metallopeptidase family protein [Candidatus Binatia bacterium]